MLSFEKPLTVLEGQDEEVKSILRGLATKRELRKGDFLFEEGDIFQRIYTITSGEVTMLRNGTPIKTLGADEVIGYVASISYHSICC